MVSSGNRSSGSPDIEPECLPAFVQCDDLARPQRMQAVRLARVVAELYLERLAAPEQFDHGADLPGGKAERRSILRHGNGVKESMCAAI